MKPDIDELERLAREAALGEWTSIPDVLGTRFIAVKNEDRVITERVQRASDAAFIAAANPATVLELIAYVREVERSRDRDIANAQSAGHKRGRMEAEAQHEHEARRLAAVNDGWPLANEKLKQRIAELERERDTAHELILGMQMTCDFGDESELRSLMRRFSDESQKVVGDAQSYADSCRTNAKMAESAALWRDKAIMLERERGGMVAISAEDAAAAIRSMDDMTSDIDPMHVVPEWAPIVKALRAHGATWKGEG